MNQTALVDPRIEPLFHPDISPPPPRARLLVVARCDPQVARALNAGWHSRLPYTQRGPWKLAFVAHYRGTAFGTALWHNTSARGLPQTWLELRRLAVADNAPHCTASYMLGRMARWIQLNMVEVDKVISYQDTSVHTGTIYRAAGWNPAWVSKARVRDRSKVRSGTHRDYRSNTNGASPDAAEKIRWERVLHRRAPGLPA